VKLSYFVSEDQRPCSIKQSLYLKIRDLV